MKKKKKKINEGARVDTKSNSAIFENSNANNSGHTILIVFEKNSSEIFFVIYILLKYD